MKAGMDYYDEPFLELLKRFTEYYYKKEGL